MDGRLTAAAAPGYATDAATTLNERSCRLADAVVERADELRIAARVLSNGTRVIDLGIDVAGGFGAGIALAELCMAGLGHVSLVPVLIGGEGWPGVQVWTDHPARCCMAAQYAGWPVQVDGYFAMGSGPLRAQALVERELFERLAYSERAERGLLVLESRRAPDARVAAWIADQASLPADRLTLAVAPTASLAGGVQVVARVVETALHKLDVLGFDVRRVESAIGTAPLPTVSATDLQAIGRTNDCILYGSQVRLVVDAPDDELAELARQLPSSSSRDHGTPFAELFERYGGDFYRIDRMLFSPAEAWLTSRVTGRTVHAGGLLPEVLRASLHGSVPGSGA